jgi:hypothetical protein
MRFLFTFLFFLSLDYGSSSDPADSSDIRSTPLFEVYVSKLNKGFLRIVKLLGLFIFKLQ